MVYKNLSKFDNADLFCLADGGWPSLVKLSCNERIVFTAVFEAIEYYNGLDSNLI